MNLHAFPFYATLNSQDRFRRGCSGHGVYGQLTAPNRFPPFQIRRDKSGALLDCVTVFRLDGSVFATLAHPAMPYTLHQTKYADYLTYYGATVAGLTMPCGFFYLGVAGFFSEVFQAANSLSAAVLLTWQNAKPIGPVYYGAGFVQTLYVTNEILEPDYRFEEEGDLNGSEVFVRDSAKLSKLRILESGGVPEYLVDALNAVPLHDEVNIGPFDELGKLTAKTVWLKGACRANVTLSFEDETPVLWNDCDDAEVVTEVSQAGFVPDMSVCNGGVDTRPRWSNTGDERCRQVGGANNGEQEIEQADGNPASLTVGSLRWIVSGENLVACPLPVSAVFRSFLINETVFRDNCISPDVPQGVVYRLEEGFRTSTVSQRAADELAVAFYNANFQLFANANDSCIAPVGDAVTCELTVDGCWTGFVVVQATGVRRQYQTQREYDGCFAAQVQVGGPIVQCPAV